MKESTNREKVLKKIRSSLINKSPSPVPHADFESPVYLTTDESPEIVFAHNFLRNGGHFVFCEDQFDFASNLLAFCEERKWNHLVCKDEAIGLFLKSCDFPFQVWPENLNTVEAVLTSCECLVSRTGSFLISSRQAQGRILPAIGKTHLVLAFKNQLVEDIKDAFQLMKWRYGTRLPSMLSFVSGPSKTADIELIPITGVHGPAEVIVFLIEQEGFR